MEAGFAVIFVLLGMIVASFLNVCADRLPAKQSLAYPPSHCPACSRRLAAKDLIPVFSYLWLRGRCRYCGAPIPRRVLWVEVATAALFGLAYWQYGFSIELPVVLFYISLFTVIFVIDLEHGLILNKIVYPALVVALVISIFVPPSQLAHISGGVAYLIDKLPQLGLAQAAIGGGIGFVIFFLIVIVSRGGMGFGDVKLAALIGLATGYLVVVALLMGIILGGLVAVILLGFKIKKRKEAMPFGPFLAVAAIATLLWGSDILSWYMNINIF
jgi:leader peptidase (prepilin peptidase)/N-methyltransferase